MENMSYWMYVNHEGVRKHTWNDTVMFALIPSNSRWSTLWEEATELTFRAASEDDCIVSLYMWHCFLNELLFLLTYGNTLHYGWGGAVPSLVHGRHWEEVWLAHSLPSSSLTHWHVSICCLTLKNVKCMNASIIMLCVHTCVMVAVAGFMMCTR